MTVEGQIALSDVWCGDKYDHKHLPCVMSQYGSQFFLTEAHCLDEPGTVWEHKMHL